MRKLSQVKAIMPDGEDRLPPSKRESARKLSLLQVSSPAGQTPTGTDVAHNLKAEWSAVKGDHHGHRRTQVHKDPRSRACANS